MAAGAERGDFAHDLMAGGDVGKAFGQFAFHHMEIGPADAADANPHQHLTGAGLGHGLISEPERLLAGRLGMCQNPGLHPESTIDAEFSRVVGILRQLRAPGGCPWDRKQTLESIRPHTLEETYEVLEAIGDRNWPGLQEELGDLLLQVLFYAEIAAEQGHFDLHGVLKELGDKLVRRHPHVFAEGSTEGMTAEQALERWNAAKRAEGGSGERTASVLAGVTRGLPALAEAHKLGQRAAGVGFDWPDASSVMAKVEEEMGELRAELGRAEPGAARVEEELGDVLFTLANLARQLGLEPETALKRANRKFQRRFERMEALAGGRTLAGQTAEEWEALWQRAKA